VRNDNNSHAMSTIFKIVNIIGLRLWHDIHVYVFEYYLFMRICIFSDKRMKENVHELKILRLLRV
jgi:hypothetical protein